MLRPCRRRVTFLGEDKDFPVSEVVAFSKSYAPPVNEASFPDFCTIPNFEKNTNRLQKKFNKPIGGNKSEGA